MLQVATPADARQAVFLFSSLLRRTYNNPQQEFHTFAYTKLADDARLSMLTETLDVTICSHAHYTVNPDTYPCKNYVGSSARRLAHRAHGTSATYVLLQLKYVNHGSKGCTHLVKRFSFCLMLVPDPDA